MMVTSLEAQDLRPPADDLVLWLRADAGVQRQGDRVVLWEDQSGRGHDATSEAATAPTWVEEAIAGQPAVRFDGLQTSMTIPHHGELNAGEAFTAFCVFRYHDGFRIAQKKDRSGGLTPDAWFIAPHAGLGVGGRYSSASMAARGEPAALTTVFDAAKHSLSVYRAGKLVDELTGLEPQQPNTDPIRLGKRDLPGGQVEQYLLAKYSIEAPVEPTLTITRVIPGHHEVRVDWLRPEKAEGIADLRYTLAVKLREEPWDSAATVTVPGDQTSACMTGLWNHADYSLRVTAHSQDAEEPLATSADRLVSPAEVPGVVVDYLHKDDTAYADAGQYVGSPTIARMDDGTLVTAHDLFGAGTNNLTRVFGSSDDGETWTHLSDVRHAFWGKLFTHRGELYLLACSRGGGDMLLHHSPDGGATWEAPVTVAAGTYHKAPVPVIEHAGKLWTCVELWKGGWPAGFEAVCLSVPVDADLTDPTNWTVSAPLPYDTAWLPEGWEIPESKQGFLEGNAVVDPQGRMLNILRYHVAPHYRKAMVLGIAEDGTSLSFDRVIDFYGGMTKFTIRRHPETKRYWSLVNRVTRPGSCGMRNVLSLVYSDDLDHWTLVRDILRDDRLFAPQYTGFQYVDWLFDGDDIIVASRTAFNGAHNFHDANHLTFHRVKDFAEGVADANP